MFNASLDAYGAIRPAAVQSASGIKNVVTSPPGLMPVVNADKVKVETVRAEAKQPAEVDKAALTAAVKKLNELVAPSLQSIQFTLDQETHGVIVKVIDTKTNEVLRQIPNEEVLAFSKTLGRLQGLVVREKV